MLDSLRAAPSPLCLVTQVYSVWKKQYFVDVLEPKHPGTKPNDETLKSKFKAAYSKVTQEEKDAIAAELD